jgi:hypothetical protein
MCLSWGCSRIGCWWKYLGLRRRNSIRLEKTIKWETAWYVFLTRYCWGVRGMRMRRDGHGHTWVINAYGILMGNREGKRPLERPWRRWEDNVGMDHKEVGLQGVAWIHLPEDRDIWRRQWTFVSHKVRRISGMTKLLKNDSAPESYVCPKLDLRCPFLVSAVKNDGISVSVLLIYRCVICFQALTKTMKNLSEWPSNTKIRSPKNANQTAWTTETYGNM